MMYAFLLLGCVGVAQPHHADISIDLRTSRHVIREGSDQLTDADGRPFS